MYSLWQLVLFYSILTNDIGEGGVFLTNYDIFFLCKLYFENTKKF